MNYEKVDLVSNTDSDSGFSDSLLAQKRIAKPGKDGDRAI
jgi:hypothetical protein